MQEFLLRIWGETRKTMLFVTHNVDEAVFLSQRIIILSERPGRIAETIHIEMPYPRDVNEPDFAQFRKEVFKYIQTI